MCVDLKKNLLILVFFIVGLVPANILRADDCEEARKWYHEGLTLSDHSEREASYYKKAIELCPEYYEAYNRLGEVYKSWGEYELAMEAFRQAGRSPSFAEPHRNLGEIYRMQGRYDLAAEALVKAIKMKPDFREAQNQLKYVQKRLGQYDAVVEAPPELIPTFIFARIPGMTLPKGSYLADLQFRYWNQEGELEVEGPAIAAESRNADVDVLIWGLRYGLTNNLTIGLIPKFFWRTANVSTFAGIDAEPTVSGFGDTVFLTKYRIWGRRRAHLSLFHLLNIPTGDEDAVGEDEGVARRIPLGSGHFDFTPGVAFTFAIEPFTMQTNIWYVIPGGTTGRQGGDEFHCDLAVALPPLRNFVSTMELNYRWADSITREQLFQTRVLRPTAIGPGGSTPGGPVNQESMVTEQGGHTLFLSPGVQIFFTEGLKMELGAQIPIIRPDEGWVEEVVFHAGLVKYFL